MLGFEPRVRWQEGLIETIDWFRRMLAESSVPPREQEPAAGRLADERAAALGVR
ncbi:MAG TPA: hypothetical protein VNV62_15805 [Trebonia sp.]|nr:hypothetical protein [Trebonia sp.]